jgi:hypothetical protein
MSHITITQTTKTVTTTSAILLNTGYLKTTSGILKILQLVGFSLDILESCFPQELVFSSFPFA